MRMSGAMLAECAEVCFLPDWKESKGAKYEFGEAMAQNKPFFFFADWERTQEETGKYECTAEKTDYCGGRTSDHQSEWLDALSAQGYKVALCYGWEQAAGTIIEYLTGGGAHD